MASILKDLGIAGATNVVGNVTSTAGQGLTSLLLGGKEGFTSWRNALTQQGLTGQQRELQKLHDTQYQRTVADLQAAGLNPAMMFGGSTTAGVVSPSSSPQEVSNADLLGGLNALQQNRVAKAQTALIWADTKGKMIDNMTKNAKNIAELSVMIADAKKKGVETDKMQRDLDLLNASFQSQVDSYMYAAQNMGETVTKTREEIKNVREERKRIIQDTALKAAQTSATAAQEELTKEQKAKAHEEVISLKADNHFVSKLKEAGIAPQILDSPVGVVLVTALGVDGMKEMVEDVRSFIHKLKEGDVSTGTVSKDTVTDIISSLFPDEDGAHATGGFGGKSSVKSGSNSSSGGGSR